MPLDRPVDPGLRHGRRGAERGSLAAGSGRPADRILRGLDAPAGALGSALSARAAARGRGTTGGPAVPADAPGARPDLPRGTRAVSGTGTRRGIVGGGPERFTWGDSARTVRGGLAAVAMGARPPRSSRPVAAPSVSTRTAAR
ncbi:hypothetical protein ACQEU5_05350 [Marinactinospora thermotolerans]|uniref:hypothetical protein n=1 Tax=Marinactinospora thermotolerans TaxID=531310 RepID=UPI00099AAB69